jgi:hypothetical protein
MPGDAAAVAVVTSNAAAAVTGVAGRPNDAQLPHYSTGCFTVALPSLDTFAETQSPLERL